MCLGEPCLLPAVTNRGYSESEYSATLPAWHTGDSRQEPCSFCASHSVSPSWAYTGNCGYTGKYGARHCPQAPRTAVPLGPPTRPAPPMPPASFSFSLKDMVLVAACRSVAGKMLGTRCQEPGSSPAPPRSRSLGCCWYSDPVLLHCHCHSRQAASGYRVPRPPQCHPRVQLVPRPSYTSTGPTDRRGHPLSHNTHPFTCR